MKCWYTLGFSTLWSATGPKYKRNCRHSVALSLSTSRRNFGRGFRANSQGTNGMKQYSLSQTLVIWAADNLWWFAFFGGLTHNRISFLTTPRQTRCMYSKGICVTKPTGSWFRMVGSAWWCSTFTLLPKPSSVLSGASVEGKRQCPLHSLLFGCIYHTHNSPSGTWYCKWMLGQVHHI